MSPDDDENSPAWDEASATNWQGVVDADDEPFLAPVSDVDDLDVQDSGDDLSNWAAPPPSVLDNNAFWRRFSPILIPLPFAIIVFLFTLPATLKGPPDHPPLLVVVLLLCALALIQGTLLYFAGSNDTFWVLDIAGGYTLFIVLGVFAGFGVFAALITFILLLVVGILLGRQGMRSTVEGYVDIVESFGKYTHTLYPGPHFVMPWEKVSQRLSTRETTWTCPPQRVPTSRDQDVQLVATISYQLLPEDAYLAVVTTQDWERNLHLLFVGTIQSVVNELTPSDFISWSQSIYVRATNDANSFNPAAATRWDRINTTLRRRMEDQTATWGVKVNWVRIQDITILPHTADDSHSAQVEERMTVPPARPPLPVPVMAAPDAPTTAITTTIIAEQASALTPASNVVAPVFKTEPATAVTTEKPINVELLKESYDAVRKGLISDSTTILGIADRFDALAADPVNSKKIDFDASRAASTLRARVQKIQSLAMSNGPAERSI